MNDKKEKRRVIADIRAWKPRPSPLRLVRAHEEAAAEKSLEDEKKKTKSSFYNYHSEDEEDGDDDSAILDEQRRFGIERNKAMAKIKVKKAERKKRTAERREERLRK